MVCKIICCSEFPNILEKAVRKTTRRRRRRAQAIAKRYAFHANAINVINNKFLQNIIFKNNIKRKRNFMIYIF